MMVILIKERLRHANDNTILSLQLGAMENIFGLMTTGLSKIASRAFEPDTLEIPKAGFGRIRGSKPQMAGAMAVPS